MSKNKEILRIESAIKTKNKEEVLWAIWYSKQRLQLAPNTYLRKSWEKTIRELTSVLDNED